MYSSEVIKFKKKNSKYIRDNSSEDESPNLEK